MFEVIFNCSLDWKLSITFWLLIDAMSDFENRLTTFKSRLFTIDQTLKPLAHSITQNWLALSSGERSLTQNW